MTHTIATLEVGGNVYDSIARLLRAAGYDHAFGADGVIDMSGIGLKPSAPNVPAGFGEFKASDLIDLQVDLANFAGMSRKRDPAPWDQVLYDRLVKNLLRCGPALLDAASTPRGEERLRGLLKAANDGRDAAEGTLAKIRDILQH